MHRKKIACISIFFLVAALFARPVSAREKIVAVILSREILPYTEALRGFKDYLDEAGEKIWIAPYNMSGETAGGQDIIKEIREKEPDLILAIGTAAAALAHEEIKEIPVVFSQVLNPVTSNLVESVKSSKNNLAGSSMDISYDVQFRMLKEALPDIKRVGVLYNPTENEATIRDALNAAHLLNLELVPVKVRDEKLVPKALMDIFPDIDVLWAVADSTVFNKGSIRFILEATIKNNVPFMGLSDHFVKAGALMALSCDYYDIGRQSGEVAMQIIKGKKPSEIPITTPRKKRLFLNLRTADYLGIKIPDEVVKTAEKIF